MNFDDAFDRVITNEGGYVNDPNDPGGETNYGISARAYPGENIRGMTLARAREIYHRDYWGPAGCDLVPDIVKFDLFDSAVNMGVRQAVKVLQRGIGATADGIIGKQTIMRLQSASPEWLLRRFTAARIRYYTSLDSFQHFGAGWMNRIASNLERA